MKLLPSIFFKNWKMLVFPPICIILYVFFTATDTYSTFLSSPDLKLETNPVSQYFKWGWYGHLLYISSMVLVTTIFAVISNKYILTHFVNKYRNIKTNSFLFIISILLLIYCFYNLIATLECTINNYLVYRYMRVISDDKIQGIAVSYVNLNLYFNEKFGVNSLIYIVSSTEIILATFIAFFQTIRVRRFVKSTISDNNQQVVV